MADDLREVARRRNERIGLGPITDPAVLRKVADLIVAWQERQAEGKELQDARLLRLQARPLSSSLLGCMALGAVTRKGEPL